jgi:hypothetical protein
MAAKKATIEANKAKGGAKKAGGLFSFGKKEAAPEPPAKKGFSFGSFGAGLPGRRKVSGAAAPAEKKGFTLFGKK